MYKKFEWKNLDFGAKKVVSVGVTNEVVVDEVVLVVKVLVVKTVVEVGVVTGLDVTGSTISVWHFLTKQDVSKVFVVSQKNKPALFSISHLQTVLVVASAATTFTQPEYKKTTKIYMSGERK